MRDEARLKRREEIENAACRLLEREGYAGASMLAVAKAVGASNETLYRWYGDKKGLFRAVAEANAGAVRVRLDAEIAGGGDPVATLAEIAAPLLAMVTGERAVALNRAAAGDPSGELGAAIAEGGREAVMPRIEALVAAAMAAGQVRVRSAGEGADLYLRLLVGDWQIRRVIGAMEAPGLIATQTRAKEAMAAFLKLCG
ncbi:MAG: TetR/AcrR family transcriptional regulator [Rhodobacteraceae bacterium]|nr:TetR/AcrR family transcriptional regulator [Paracoccaceae bacterium]